MRWIALIPLMVPVAGLGWAGWSRRWFAEDAFISLRSVDNLLAGHGPVFNVGERVEGSTSALWQFMLAAFGPLRGVLPLEWWAVLIGLVLTLVGLTLGQWGALLLAPRARSRWALPFGALVVAALPPFWDFATSGLETGLGFGWLGTCFWGLARHHTRVRGALPAKMQAASPEARGAPLWPNGRYQTDPLLRTVVAAPRWLVILVGLGPLIRPDFAVFSLGFIVLVLFAARGLGRAAILRTVAWTVSIPVIYEVLRAGVYGILTPTPALAKEATRTSWAQGTRYGLDLARPYVLWLPLIVAVAVLGVIAVRSRRDRGAIPLLLAPPVLGLLHAAFVIGVGGDFMHGRLLLPSLFSLLLPVSAVATTRLTVPAVILMAAWAGASAVGMRVPYRCIGPDGIADERSYYVAGSGKTHPVTIEDYDRFVWARDGRAIRDSIRASQRFTNLAITPERFVTLPLASTVSAPVAVSRNNVGMLAYAAGPRAYVGDQLGLVDPLAARVRLPQIRSDRIGHEKYLPPVWYAARLVPTDAPVPPEVASIEELAAARRALACPPLRELFAAVRSPLSLGRVFQNLTEAWGMTSLRFSPDPFEAERELCAGESSPRQGQPEAAKGNAPGERYRPVLWPRPPCPTPLAEDEDRPSAWAPLGTRHSELQSQHHRLVDHAGIRPP